MQKLIGVLGNAGSARVARIAIMSMLMGSLTLSAACFGNKKEDEAAEPVPATMLKVENQAFLDMTIYVYRSSQRVRLGIANGNSTTRFVIPPNLIFGSTPLRFQGDPIGRNRQPISQEITVSPGDEVVLTIPPTA
ncbi:MAG: hypothetical protein JWL61_3885 [Gemmatimonadetes bacterium]|jgi:hypothetical protein|nr:hypothetical protein [Gemmatimonadota bacterium]